MDGSMGRLELLLSKEQADSTLDAYALPKRKTFIEALTRQQGLVSEMCS